MTEKNEAVATPEATEPPARKKPGPKPGFKKAKQAAAVKGAKGATKAAKLIAGGKGVPVAASSLLKLRAKVVKAAEKRVAAIDKLIDQVTAISTTNK